MGPRFVRIPSSTTPHDGRRNEEDLLLKLEQLLVRALPKSVQILNLCRIACQNRFPVGIDVQFYIYTEGDQDEWWNKKDDNDPFVVCVERPNMHTTKGIILLTPPSPTPEMVTAFDQFVGWSESQVFHCVQPPFWPHLEKLCNSHKNLKPEHSAGIPGVMFAILDMERAKSLTAGAPEGAVVRFLEQKNVSEMVAQWKWAVADSEQVMRKCVKSLVSCGLFVGGAEEEEEELASYVLLSPIGSFNVLYTPEKHRRKGYGAVVMEWIAKQTAIQLGIPPMSEIEIWNDASRNLMEKVGFEEVFKTKWYYYDPPPTNPPTQ